MRVQRRIVSYSRRCLCVCLSNYKTMQAWFYQPDSLAENLAALFNRIAAGRVPAPIIPLLTAGRGVAIPKPSGIGLRPVVVGSIVLRFVGSLALVQKSAETAVKESPDSEPRRGAGEAEGEGGGWVGTKKIGPRGQLFSLRALQGRVFL